MPNHGFVTFTVRCFTCGRPARKPAPRRLVTRKLAATLLPAVAIAAAGMCVATPLLADNKSADSSGYFTDPATGIVYRKVHRTVERPIVETQMQTQASTYYRPETVYESRPETRTTYTPVVSYGWEPRLRNRWNPFAQPTIQYEHTPRMHWEARTETVERREARTNWVAEHRQTEVPKQIVKIQREEKVDYEAVGRVANPPNSADTSIASRLRPLDQSTPIAPLGSTYASTASYPNDNFAGRSNDQTGLRATELAPSGGVHVTPLPPPSVGIATSPYLPIWR